LSGPTYLTLDEVVELHERVMRQVGSSPAPLLREPLLVSALYRVQHLAHYDPESDIVSQAVILAVGVSQAQAFQDGNKRTALIATDTFLALNGYRNDASSDMFACWLICIAGNISNEELDLVAEHMGLDLAAELDGLHRDQVVARFDDWLRRNVSLVDPAELMQAEE
jgi:death-on-curing protein